MNTSITIQNSFKTGYFAEEAIDANGCSVLFEVYMSEPDPVELRVVLMIILVIIMVILLLFRCIRWSNWRRESYRS